MDMDVKVHVVHCVNLYHKWWYKHACGTDVKPIVSTMHQWTKLAFLDKIHIP